VATLLRPGPDTTSVVVVSTVRMRIDLVYKKSINKHFSWKKLKKKTFF